MRGIEQSIKTFAMPQESQRDRRAGGRRHSHERVNGDPVCVTALDPRDEGAGHAGFCGEACLRPSPSMTKGPDAETEPDDIHAAA